uniref:Uncharacterized protein n=1 Tax=Arundo donax TaxID=35708 RepID=A0A0A8Y0K2_ARUDO
MAGRFMFQNFSSCVSRSRTLFGSHASASARDVAPVASRASEGVISAPGNLLLHGASAHPTTAVPNYCGIHGYAARYNTLTCSRPATAKKGSPITGMPSVITTHRMKPAHVDSIFWESGTTACEAEMKAKKADLDPRSACKAEMEAGKAALDHRSACKAEMEAEKKAFAESPPARKAKLDKNAAEFNAIVTSLVLVWSLVGLYWAFQTFSESKRERQGESSQDAVKNPSVA